MAGPSVEIASLSACRSQANARRWGRRAQYQVWNFSYTVLRVRSKKWMSRFMIGPAGADPPERVPIKITRHARAQRRSPHGATAPSLASRATAGSARASPPKRGARRRKRNAGTPVPDYAATNYLKRSKTWRPARAGMTEHRVGGVQPPSRHDRASHSP